MTQPVLPTPPIDLRQRMIEDMEMRRFSRETQRNYPRDLLAVPQPVRPEAPAGEAAPEPWRCCPCCGGQMVVIDSVPWRAMLRRIENCTIDMPVLSIISS